MIRSNRLYIKIKFTFKDCIGSLHKPMPAATLHFQPPPSRPWMCVYASPATDSLAIAVLGNSLHTSLSLAVQLRSFRLTNTTTEMLYIEQTFN